MTFPASSPCLPEARMNWRSMVTRRGSGGGGGGDDDGCGDGIPVTIPPVRVYAPANCSGVVFGAGHVRKS